MSCNKEHSKKLEHTFLKEITYSIQFKFKNLFFLSNVSHVSVVTGYNNYLVPEIKCHLFLKIFSNLIIAQPGCAAVST